MKYKFLSVRSVLENAVRWTDAYRECDPEDIRSFPIVNKKDHRSSPENYLSNKTYPFDRSSLLKALVDLNHTGSESACANISGVVFDRSSGTSGPPISYPRTLREQLVLFHQHGKMRKNISSEFSYNKFCDLGDMLVKVERESGRSNSEVVDMAFEKVYKIQASHLHGQYGLVASFLSWMKKNSINSCVKLIELTGEYLDESRLDEIQQISGAKVVNLYGSREVWTIGVASDDGNGFEVSENVYVEILDDRGEKIDEPDILGNIVVTSCLLELFPVIRFDLGDLGFWKWESGRRKLCLLDHRQASDLRTECGTRLPGKKFLQSCINNAFSSIGSWVKGDWKARSTGNLLRVFFSDESDFLGVDAVAEILREQRQFHSFTKVEFCRWEGWRVDEKRILYFEVEVAEGLFADDLVLGRRLI